MTSTFVSNFYLNFVLFHQPQPQVEPQCHFIFFCNFREFIAFFFIYFIYFGSIIERKHRLRNPHFWVLSLHRQWNSEIYPSYHFCWLKKLVCYLNFFLEIKIIEENLHFETILWCFVTHLLICLMKRLIRNR